MLQDHPDTTPAAAHKLLAYVFLRLNDPRHSLEQYTRAAALERPDNIDLENVAKDYVLLGDLATAEKWMTASISMSPQDPEGWYGLGRIRFSQQRFEEAARCFNQSLKLLPKSVKAEDNLGLAYEGMNEQEKAEAAYRQAIAWQQGSPHPSEQPLLNLGVLLVQRGDFTNAETLLTQAAAIAPDEPRIHEQLGHLYLGTHQLVQAQQHLELAVRLDPKRAALHFLLGKVYHQLHLEAQAKTEFETASSLSGYHSTPEAHP
jgi:Flp pilus assembly protein TadD